MNSSLCGFVCETGRTGACQRLYLCDDICCSGHLKCLRRLQTMLTVEGRGGWPGSGTTVHCRGIGSAKFWLCCCSQIIIT
jgi:hypothetical protein